VRGSIVATMCVAIVGMAALAGCGNLASSSAAGASSAAGSGSSGGDAVSASKLASLKAELTQAAKVPSFRAPGPAFNAKSASGKTVVAVPFNSQIPYCSGLITDMQSIGGSMGVKVVNYTATGEVSQFEAAATQAAAVHASAFTTICGVDPSSITPQLAMLKSKGIPTVALLGDVSLPAPSNVQGVTSIQLVKSAQTLADDAIVQNNGKPFHALILTDDDIFGEQAPTNAAVDELKNVCGSNCPSTVVNVPSSNWQSGVSSQVSAELNRDPKITAIIAIYDGMVEGMMPAVTGAHRAGLHVYTYGASPGVVDLIKSTNGTVAADIGAGSSWSAYIQMDQVLRVLLGKPAQPVADEYPGLRLWTLSNASQINSANPYGTSFVSGFEKLWGVS
jgi:ribose transport system substrate-binding protein